VLKPVVPSANATYSVQVGAFKQRQDAEVTAKSLEAKGFQPVIEDPRLPSPYYLVKVGRFELRADAYAMQQKVKKAGFACFIKTN
jgi:cell division protein FtsN